MIKSVFLLTLLSLNVWANDTHCENHILIAGLGDILVHDALQLDAARSPERFYSLFRDVTPFVSAADIAYGNLESPVAMGITADGKDLGDIGFRYDRRVYSGTNMRFNFHPQIIDDIMQLGVDIVSTANNHALDRRSIGIDRTILELNKKQLAFTGTRMSSGEGEWGRVTSVKGKRIYWLSCTDHLNGNVDRYNQVLRCFANENEISQLVRAASDEYDAVILLPHWGDEYSQSPNTQQRRWAQKMSSLGVTAIIGNHPHVMQPVERIGSMVVAYSLGNFIAWQKGTERKTSVILYLRLESSVSGKLQVTEYNGVPVYRVAQQFFPAVDRIDSEALRYVSKHLGRDHIVLGKDLPAITRCQ